MAARPTRPPGREAGEIGYRLDVLAPSVADAVESAGGLMVDRALAGWMVTAFVDDDGEDADSLQILGVQHRGLSSALTFAERRDPPRSVVVANSLADTQPRVRTLIRRLLTRGSEVALYGDELNEGFPHPGDLIQYRLSSAALAFKRYALLSSGLSANEISATEVYHRAPNAWSATSTLLRAN